jgi:phospholipase/lecithinase/hemolysin
LVAIGSLLASCGPALAATVTLKDGTSIQGEVKSLQDGVYTIESASIGTLHVRAEQVRSIEESGKSTPPAGVGSLPSEPSSGASALDATTALIAQDPALLATVLELQSDPDMIAVLADPEIMKAIAAGDYAALMSNPKIVALLKNPKIRAIIDATK